MLTKEDKGEIQEIVTNSLNEFWDKTLEPYFTRIEKFMAESKDSFKENSHEHEQMFRLLERNRDEHDEFFENEKGLEKQLLDHETRLKKLENN